MNDIEIEKKLDFLPYVSSNVSGVREKYYDRVNYDTPQLNYGIGFNYELNKNLSEYVRYPIVFFDGTVLKLGVSS